MLRNRDIIDVETGEAFLNVTVTTDRDRQNYKKILEAKQKYEFQGVEIQKQYKKYGSFVWLLYNAGQVLDLGIQPDELTKLIYISTYMGYNNRLMVSEDESMTKKQMREILHVSEDTFHKFYISLTNTGILSEDIDKCLYLNTSIFKRGAIKDVKDIDCNRTRLYIKSIRSLYTQAKISEHKLLSYLFQAIPFVNVNYNILCFNPLENDLQKVKPMIMKDFCVIIGYSQDNDRRLKTKLKGLRLHQLPVFSFVDNADGLFCYINPNVYYAGNKWEEVKVLGRFQKENT